MNEQHAISPLSAKNSTARSAGIWVRNRGTGNIEPEAVFGESYLRWVYESSVGRRLGSVLSSNPLFSKLYGWLQSTRLSSRKIPGFINRFNIPMELYEPGPFPSFNRFFIRKFKPGMRPFTPVARELPAFAEGRYCAFARLDPHNTFPVKGTNLYAEALLGSIEKAQPFIGGPIVIARLCPTDYHRFHFPDDGKVVEQYRLHGSFHSVSPVALARKSDVLITNERQVTILETVNFGRMAYIEVGALCVGRIVQTGKDVFRRGDEKGYFLFGGSTVVLIGVAGAWLPDADLLEHTTQHRETLVKLGERIGTRP